MRALLLLMACATAMPCLHAQHEESPTVGVAAEIDQLVLPGSELIVRRTEDLHEPLVLRIKAVFRHGTANRYDLIYYGLEPGEYDLRDYLVRKDGSSKEGLPAISVEVRALMPMLPIEPNSPQPHRVEGPGGYRRILIFVGIAWVLGLGLMFQRRRRRQRVAEASQRGPLSLADHLAPRVEAALKGTLSAEGQAELERMLLVFWRRRLGLEGMKAAEAMAALRSHPESGPLLAQLELWLHHPGRVASVDLAPLLAPYRNLAAESVGEAACGAEVRGP